MENIYKIEFWDKLSEIQQKELIQYIEASKAYYTDELILDGFDILDDAQFDALSDTLIDYNIPELTKFIESRIFRIDENEAGGMMEVTSEFNQTQEMISLKKIKFKDLSSITEIKAFFRDAIKSQKELCYGPKFDGAALKITFDLDFTNIVQIISRGGLDVTEIFKNHPLIKDTIKYKKHIVCGELLIKKSIFIDKYFDDGSEDDSDIKKYKNPRNFVSKLLKQKEISSEILNNIDFIACTDGVNHLKENQHVWKKLESLNYLYQLPEIIKKLKSEDFPYLCDGIVIGYFEEGERQIKDNYPLNMVAIKFPATTVNTIITGFDWSQKKSGKLTPRIMLEPVNLDGSTVSFTAGYNYQYLLDNHIGIGSKIEICKSGDIIPVIVKVKSFSNQINMPECDYTRSGKHLIAINIEESIKFKFISAIKLLQIDGIGETLATQIGEIVDYKIIELFNQEHKPAICKVLGGGVNWNKFQEFYNIKSLYLDQLIALLQFDGVGVVLSKKVAMLITKKSNDTSNMSSHVLANVCKGHGFIKINSSINELKTYGIKILPPIEITEGTITFEMTSESGKIYKNLNKTDFVKQLKIKFPNSEHTSLTKETKYLFTDNINGNTSKMNKARKYNIQIMTYEQALNSNKL